jgi:hypothetical protein
MAENDFQEKSMDVLSLFKVAYNNQGEVPNEPNG